MNGTVNRFCCLLVFFCCIASNLDAAAPNLRSLGQLRSCAAMTTGIAVDNAGNLFLAKAELETVAKFDVYGRKLQSFAPLPLSAGGMAVAPLGDAIYLPSGENSVLRLNGDNGTVVGSIPHEDRIVALDLDSRGELYLGESTGRVLVYNAAGRFLRVFSAFDDEQKQLLALAVNRLADEVWMAVGDLRDGGRIGLRIFDRQGRLQQQMALADGFGDGRIGMFAAMTFDPLGRLYVFDRQNGAVHCLDLRSGGSSSAEVAGFAAVEDSVPVGMAIDQVSCRLFVYCGQEVFILQID